MTPIEWLPMIDWFIGEENGISIYVNIAKGFKRMLPSGQTYA